jgi:hypothetical protein
MSTTTTTPRDPSALADEVRALATEAYRSLTDPSPGGPDSRDLTRRISRLQRQIDGLDADELSTWLENLRRRFDTPVVKFGGTGITQGPRRVGSPHVESELTIAAD